MATAVITQTRPETLELELSNASFEQRRESDSRSDLGSRLGSDDEADGNAIEAEGQNISRARAIILITTLTGLTFIGSMSSGLLTIGLPIIAADLKLPENLLLW